MGKKNSPIGIRGWNSKVVVLIMLLNIGCLLVLWTSKFLRRENKKKKLKRSACVAIGMIHRGFTSNYLSYGLQHTSYSEIGLNSVYGTLHSKYSSMLINLCTRLHLQTLITSARKLKYYSLLHLFSRFEVYKFGIQLTL